MQFDSTASPDCKSQRIVDHDHQYETSPATLHRRLFECKPKLKEKEKIIKMQKRKLNQLQKKASSFRDMINELRRSVKVQVSEACLRSLESIRDSDIQEFLQRVINNSKSNSISRMQYSPALRSFALTLFYYSPKAYNYVRDKMNSALPAPSTLRSWYNSIDGEAGFTTESFEALSRKVEEAKTKNQKVLCSLMIDEIGIKKGTQRGRDGKVYGHVDYGPEFVLNDNSKEAKNALVFMVVGLDSNWKLPIAYFLINGIASETSAVLIENTLVQLHEIGDEVVSLTLDGPNEHFATVQKLGAVFSENKIQPYFSHPITSKPIYVIFDACHMLKLIRNAFGEGKILLDNKGNKIEWRYIVQLAKLQEAESLRAGNKLRLRHIDYYKMKMKVNLAAQTLSQSVADALEFCLKELQLPEFEGCEATIEFIRSIDILFDFLNSRNPYGQGYKAPLTIKNEHIWRSRIEELLTNISTLRNGENKLMFSSTRKVGFLGMYSACLAVISIYEKYVKAPNSQMKYLLTYKLSQDHLELFFCAIRARSGWCPNPTAMQFRASYKRLLIHNEIKAINGNVTMQDNTKILMVSSSLGKKAFLDRYNPEVYDTMANIRVCNKYDLTDELTIEKNSN